MATTYNRREFLQTSFIAGIGTTMANPVFSIFKNNKIILGETRRARGFTPYFLGEDLLRLVQLSAVDKAARQAVTVNFQYFQLGNAWELSAEELFKVFADSKNLWKGEAEADRAQTQFALACGQVAHQAISKALESAERTGNTGISEQEMYRDAHILKMLQNADPHKKNVPIDKNIEGVEVEEVRELFALIHQRNLIRLHTLRCEWSGVEPWLDNILTYKGQLKNDHQKYAEIYCRPNAAKVNEYVLQNNFYDENEDLIKTARDFQMVNIGALHISNEKIKLASPKSKYGMALKSAWEKTNACGEYVLGEMGEREFMKTLNG